jgi:hypothetical protein
MNTTSVPASSESPVPRALPVAAADAPPRAQLSIYPEPFATMMKGRPKRPLSDLFGLKSFGVNYVTLAPGAFPPSTIGTLSRTSLCSC